MAVIRTQASSKATTLVAARKARTSIWSSQTLTAGAADTTSSTVSVAEGMRGGVHVRIENGATGPTLAADVEVWASYDTSGTIWVLLATVEGSTANDGVVTGEVPLDDSVVAVKLVGGGNTGQNVTAKADLVATRM